MSGLYVLFFKSRGQKLTKPPLAATEMMSVFGSWTGLASDSSTPVPMLPGPYCNSSPVARL